MTRRTTIIPLFVAILVSCSSQEAVRPMEEVSFIGSWKFVSHVVSSCDLASDNKENRCTGTASECGVLTLSDNAWSWEQALPDGTVFTESGTFYISTNTIVLTSSESPGLMKYSITGSAMMYTKTTLTFVSNGISDGCTYTQTYSRYTLVSAPHG